MKKILIILTLIGSIFFTTSCGTLEKGGAYSLIDQSEDKVLYMSDSAYKLAYTVLDSVFLFEKQNRQVLWDLNPEIKRSIDGMRKFAVQYQKDWAVARKTYIDFPVTENATKLQEVVAQMQRLAQLASVVVVRYNNP